MNGRRRLVLALGSAALTAPLSPLAQQSAKTYRVGFLSSEAASDDRDVARLSTLRNGLRELGYVEGRNLVIEARFAGGSYDRLPELAQALVAMKVDVLVASGTKPLIAASHATTSIPFVMGSSGDALGLGLTSNLARPTRNVTGWTFFGTEVSSKLVELLKECAPRTARLGYLFNPAESGYAMDAIKRAASSVAVGLTPIEVRTPPEIAGAFDRLKAASCDAVLVQAGSMFAVNAKAIADLALKNGLPSGSPLYEYAEVGGLLSYGPDRLEGYRRAAVFTDKLLKGSKVADLPIEQANKFELMINMRAAKALGLSIPQPLAARARLI